MERTMSRPVRPTTRVVTMSAFLRHARCGLGGQKHRCGWEPLVLLTSLGTFGLHSYRIL